MRKIGLDKFYTKPEVAYQCVDWLKKYYNINYIYFLEPSAGDGSFIKYLTKYEAYDIVPENSNIIKQDFLTLTTTSADFAVGNPPFGKRSSLALLFLNHSAELCDAIAFILPVSFMKWSVQKQINKDLKLVDYFYLEPNSFTDKGKDFSIRCVFQLWVKKDGKYDKNFNDKRLIAPPPIHHNDFKIWQYNATVQSVNVVEEDWDIAIYRQGYHNYNQIFNHNDYHYIKSKMTGTTKQQFIFVKPKNQQVYNNIISMDFNALAERNISTPGFGKADFVSYYTEIFDFSQ